MNQSYPTHRSVAACRLLLPQTFVACCQAQMLSKGGRCKTFDDTASGYARGHVAGTGLGGLVG